MNFRLLSRTLGIICILMSITMLFSLPWAHPSLGWRKMIEFRPVEFERQAFKALLYSSSIAAACGLFLVWWGRDTRGQPLFRKEALAVVGLSWILATLLGALPYLLAEVKHTSGQNISFVDALFEAQSGFSTTGATILDDLDDPALVPHCILFWRSSTHFLGGLGIVVLLVAILGQGAAGKAMMRAEITGPTKDSAYSRMQKTAAVFAGIYVALNLILALLFWILGMTIFDALCHAFATLATGGFSTYNASLGAFQSEAIEHLTVVFMILGGTNFGLLSLVATGHGKKLLQDTEWRVYIGLIVLVTAAVISVGMWSGTFSDLRSAFRYSLFQVVSILTTTGFGTDDFDQWNNFGRGVLLLLMFVGGCAGSTSGSMKVIRHVMFAKILRLELELAYRPNVIRPLRIGGTTLDDPALRRQILVYFGLVSAVFASSWLLLITIEPDHQWLAAAGRGPAENHLDQKLIDCGSAIAATLHNIGPALGVVGPTENYAHFAPWSKLLFIFLMMLGRLEMYAILVLFIPAFWRKI